METESSILPVLCVVLAIVWIGYHLLRSKNYRSFSFRSWHIHSNLLGIALSTTAFNQLPSALVQSAQPKTRSRASAFYDLGIVWAILGLFLSLGLLASQAWSVGASLWSFLSAANDVAVNEQNISSIAVSEIPSLVRRVPPVEPAADSGFIKPLIPGVTIPFSQAFYLVLSFLIAQLIHEPGHAISAALSSISPLLVTVQLSPIFPSASVTLPSIELAQTPPRERARIVAAGCWHNILSVLGLGLLTLLARQTFTPVSLIGRAVVGFQPLSALEQAIPMGSIITHLNDRPLGSTSPGRSDQLWSDMLTGDSTDSLNLTSGWCVSEAWFLAQNDTCCDLSSDVSPDPTICFNPSIAGSASSLTSRSPSSGRCLPPSIMLASPPSEIAQKTSRRCPCSVSGEICVEPDESRGEIIRITFLSPRSSNSLNRTNGRWENIGESIVWQGPRQSIYSQIETSSDIPPALFSRSMYSKIQAIALLTRYVIVISTTLAIFNLLPLGLLDGGFLVDALLDWGLPVGEREDDSQRERWREGSEDTIGASSEHGSYDESGGTEDELEEHAEDDLEEAAARDEYELPTRRVQGIDNTNDISSRGIRGRRAGTPRIISHAERKRRKLKRKIKSVLAGLTTGLGIWVLGGMAVRLALDLRT